MTVAALITGVLFRTPEAKTSNTGKTYVRATIRAGAEGEASEFWAVLAFGDTARAELMRLHDGDRISAQGKPRFEIFEKDGKLRIRYTIFVDSVLALRAPPRERKPKQPQNNRPTSTLPPTEQTRGGDLDDDIPF